jgi:15-cis-phytoene synthase
MTPADYCQERAAPAGSSLHYALLCLPEPKRSAVVALQAFRSEVCEVADECPDARVARAKLAWWREELSRAFSRSPEHPIGHAMRDAAERFSLRPDPFLDVIDGLEQHLAQPSYADAEALLLYCRRVASALGLMEAEVLGYRHAETPHFAQNLQVAVRLTELLRDVRRHLARGRCHIPDEDLARCGIGRQELVGASGSPELRELFRLQAERARACYRRALGLLADEDRHGQRSGIVLATLHLSLLDEMERDGYRLLERQVALTPLRKLWIAWRTERLGSRPERAAA